MSSGQSVGTCNCASPTGSAGRASSAGTGADGSAGKSSQGGGQNTGGRLSAGGRDAGGETSTGQAGEAPSNVMAPTYMATGTFDEEQVYLMGTLAPATCGADAVAHWSTPNFALTGFDCDVGHSNFAIRPSDGRFIFPMSGSTTNEYLAFVPDGTGTQPYPKDPHRNDIPLLGVCANPRDYFLDPEGGESVYLCYGLPPCSVSAATKCAYYYDQSQKEYAVPPGYYLLHLGFGGHALLGQKAGTESWTVTTPDGQLLPASQYFSVSTMRAHKSGFWLLRATTVALERWNLGFDGSLMRDGLYPNPPLSSRYTGTCAFEAQGAIVCFARSTEVSLEDHIVRAELGAAEGQIVYSEASDPLLKIHISSLVTGP